MAASYSELWIRPHDEAACQAVASLFKGVDKPGAWTRAWKRDFDSQRLTPENVATLVRESALHTPDFDSVYLAMYDGPVAELCGSFMYEHREDGEVRRALVYLPGPGVEKRRWRRVEGVPEDWEAPTISRELDDAIERWLDKYRWNVPPLPLPSPAQIAAARQKWSSFVQGEEHPYISEYSLAAAVHRELAKPG